MLRFSYDLNGQRQAKIERSYGNVVHTTKYFYDGTKLAGEKKDDTIVWYDYDENGAPVGMRVNGLDYIFRKNLQGDITGIYNSSDELIVEYTYSDAWGAGVTVSGSAASTIGMYNSFRYRGYYYDTESGLYYLNSRYYDPVACRFINTDEYLFSDDATGMNLYSYCNNNPVNSSDLTGHAPSILLPISKVFFLLWLMGHGKPVYWDNYSMVANKLKNSKIMKEKIQQDIQGYNNNTDYGKGDVCFDSSEVDLWLSIRNAYYELSIQPEERTSGFWFFKKTETWYVVAIKVYDTYNFNKGDETGDGIGSILNNIGYWAQEKNLGTSYYWEVNYVYETKYN